MKYHGGVDPISQCSVLTGIFLHCTDEFQRSCRAFCFSLRLAARTAQAISTCSTTHQTQLAAPRHRDPPWTRRAILRPSAGAASRIICSRPKRAHTLGRCSSHPGTTEPVLIASLPVPSRCSDAASRKWRWPEKEVVVVVVVVVVGVGGWWWWW